MVERDIREKFPVLKQEINGRQVVYFDNAATTQKPEEVIETVNSFYREDNANVHRASHSLSGRATKRFEQVRAKTAKFLNASREEEIIFVRGATEALNLVATCWGLDNLTASDEIILTVLEHHSNLVPWQQVSQKTGAELRFVNIDENGNLDYDHYSSLLNKNTALVAFNQMSNVLGTIIDPDKIIKPARKVGGRVLIDGAQSVPHLPVDVQELEPDFLVFSGHKMCGPTGVGVLYARRELLEEMEPYQFGGEMIGRVKKQSSTWADPPHKFEAGTPAIAQVVGLGAAVDFIEDVGRGRIRDHEIKLEKYAREKMNKIEGLEIYGEPENRGGVISFNLEGIHPHDLTQIIDRDAIACRAGHHCARPLMEELGLQATARASFYFYNTREEVDRLVEALKKTKEYFSDVVG